MMTRSKAEQAKQEIKTAAATARAKVEEAEQAHVEVVEDAKEEIRTAGQIAKAKIEEAGVRWLGGMTVRAFILLITSQTILIITALQAYQTVKEYIAPTPPPQITVTPVPVTVVIQDEYGRPATLPRKPRQPQSQPTPKTPSPLPPLPGDI